MKRWHKILLVLLVVTLAAAVYGIYLYNKQPADVRSLKASYELTAAALVLEYNEDETAANQKYLDKVIAVKGTVAEVKIEPETGQTTVILDSGDPLAGVTCSFYKEEAEGIKQLKQGSEVIIKGRCTGKLMDVVLNKCSIGK